MPDANISVIPRPASVKVSGGFFSSSGLPVIEGPDCFEPEMGAARTRLEAACALAGIARTTDAGRKIVCYREEGSGSWPEEESYRLCIGAEAIRIYASAGAGAHHAFETLRQLALSGGHEGRLVIPQAEIEDRPRFRWRGFMLDVSRHFYQAPFIKKLLDALSLHHINVFHWHLTDDQGWRFEVPEYPELVKTGSMRRDIHHEEERWTGGFYSGEDIASIVEYAQSLHIAIVPEADFPGHASAILAAYPSLGCSGGPYQVEERHGVFKDILCAGRDETLRLAEAAFTSLCRLFPSSYIHIGGDEVPTTRWEACPRCRARLKELGCSKAGELQAWLTSRYTEILKRLGKTAIGWDEVLDNADGAYPLPEGTVVMSWRGREGGLKAARAGYPVIMTPCSDGCYLDFRHFDDPCEIGVQWAGAATLESSYAADPAAGMDESAAARVLGGQGNLWSELISADKLAEYMLFPRLCALSEAFWTPADGKDFSRFRRDLAVHQQRLYKLGLNPKHYEPLS